MAMANSNILPEFFDPITHEIMTDPVIGPDGHTYERSSIIEWFKYSNTSPITRQVMYSTQLTPNIALKNTIQQIMSNVTVSTETAPIVVALPPKPEYSTDVQIKGIEYDGSTFVHVKVVPETYGTRQATGLIAVVDVSGSMGEEASVKSDSVEIVGFSRLDLVKHSLNTIVNAMNDNDIFSIITFSSDAKLVMKPMKMNSFGKNLALTLIDSLRPDANTNLWSGLHTGLEVSKDPIFEGTNKTICILTDGASNQDPPRGIIPTYENYIRTNGNNVNVHTFGYGYNLDATLLNNITDISHGTYSYIPDCTMVGTIFINFLSYILSSYSMNNILTISPHGTNTIEKVYGYNDTHINIGNLQFGQSRDFIFKINPNDSPYVKVSVNINGKVIEKELTEISKEVDSDIIYHYARLNLVQVLKLALTNSLANSSRMIAELTTFINALPKDPRIDKILVDLHSDLDSEGQISKAFSRQDWYNKWGRYFIPSIMRANQLQYCNNFKDKSVQLFGGRNFNELQDFVNDIFCKLKPPTPSLASRYSYSASYAAPQTLASLADDNIGCFDGNSLIKMHDDTYAPVKNVQSGDYVWTPDGPARINTTIKINVPKKSAKLVKINGMLITPWHPIHVNSEWIFPHDCNLGQYEITPIDYVYNLVLDNGHIVDINDIMVCTLGHGFKGKVIEHDFFGTNKVIEYLKVMNGYDNGMVYIEKPKFLHDQLTGLINGWIDDII